MPQDRRYKYALPRPEKYLMIMVANVLSNLRNGKEATIRVESLLQRAHNLVTEGGVIPYRDWDADTTFVE